MRKFIFVIFIIPFIFLSTGWSWLNKKKPAITINNLSITPQEFEESFKISHFAEKSVSSRKEFLDNLITKKLILEKAEEMGLDKDPAFLKDVQIFWEQSLLKLVLSRKINQLSARIRINDKEVDNYYRRNKEKLFAGKALPDVYSRIKWLLFKRKQSQAIREWVSSLRENAKIKIDYKMLGIKEK